MMIVTIVVLMLACVVSFVVAQIYLNKSSDAGEVVPSQFNKSVTFFSISFLLYTAVGVLVAFFG